MTKLRCRVAFSAVLVFAPLSAVAVGVAPEPAASAGSPSYTVFELPVIGSSAFIGQTSGLVFTNYKEFQIDDSSDSVTQLPVPSSPSYWTDNGTFATTHGAFVAMSMNSSGEFSGTITSGPDAGYGGIWDNGSVTAVAPIASVTGSGYVQATPATFVYSESLTNGKPSVDLSVINDEGLAGGTESFNCTFYDSGFPGGAGCQPRTIAVLWNGGSLQVASGQLSATEDVGYDCGPTGVYPSQLNTLNNGGGMAGVACGLLPTGSSPPAGVAYFTWQAGGAPELACTGRGTLSSHEGVLCATLPSDFRPATFNASDTAVGVGLVNNQYNDTAEVWSASQGLTNLNSLVNVPVGLGGPEGIDDNGDILGVTKGIVGQQYIAIPQPPPPPAVTGVSPSTGAIGGGKSVTITGKNLELASAVNFVLANGKTATVSLKQTQVSWTGTSLSVTTPNVSSLLDGASTAVADVTVTGQGGTSETDPTQTFTFEAPPTVTSVTTASCDAAAQVTSPCLGSLQGGQTVTVGGSGFTHDAKVTFVLQGDKGTYPGTVSSVAPTGTSMSVVTPNVLTDPATTPLPTPPELLADVEVTTTGGTSAVNRPGDEYAFGSPAVTSVTTATCDASQQAVSPCLGPVKGGQTVTVTGFGFTPDTTVDFVLQADGDAIGVTPTDVTVAPTGTSMSVVTPDVATDTAAQRTPTTPPTVLYADVEVTTTAGTSAVKRPGDEYGFSELSVTKVTPRGGSVGGGTQVTITGSGFAKATAVQFVDTSCDGDQEVVTVPADQFTVGTDGTVIVLNAPAETTNYKSDVPTGCQSKSLVTNVVVLAGGDSSPVTTKDRYTFGPVVTGLSARQGPSAGGTDLVVSGTGFAGATTLEFQDTGCAQGAGTAVAETFTATEFTVNTSGTEITLKTTDDTGEWQTACATGTPAVDGIPTNVVVETPEHDDPTSLLESPVTTKDLFTFDFPTVTSVTAHAGPAVGGQLVTVSGSGLTGADQVYFSFTHTGTGGSCPAVPTSVAPGGTSLTVKTPDLEATTLGCELPSGVQTLPTDVYVTGADANGVSYQTKTGSGQAQYTFQSLSVTKVAVTAPVNPEATGLSAGSIVGGYTLSVTGTGFVVPNGGKLAVCLDPVATDAKQRCLATSAVNVVSSTRLEVTVPDIATTAKYAGTGGVFPVNVVVRLTPSKGANATSPTTPADLFTLEVPEVTAVKDTVTGANDGSVLGGQTIQITGSGFIVPTGGTVKVCFVASGKPGSRCLDDANQADPQVSVGSADQLSVTSPDWSTVVPTLPAGTPTLSTNVVVTVSTVGTTKGKKVTNGVTSPTTSADTFTFEVAPTAPRTLKSTATTSSSVSLAWTAPASPGASAITGFLVYETGNQVATAGPTTLADTVSTLTPGTTYQFTVKAENGVGASDPSNTASVTTTAEAPVTTPPAPPPGATSFGQGSSTTAGGSAVAANAGVTVEAKGVGGVTVAQYGSDPVGPPTFDASGSYFDVAVSAGNSFASISVEDCSLGRGSALAWWNGAAWEPVTPLSGPSGTPRCATAVLTTTSSPNIADLSGTVFAVVITKTPKITGPRRATFTVGEAGSFQLKASGSPVPSFTETGTLPTGIGFSTTGVLSGTPAPGTGGSYRVTVTATNGVGSPATRPFMLVVDEAPTITSPALATFTVGKSGKFEVTATGYPPATFGEAGSLPKGVSLSANGKLSGTPAPTTAGTYQVTITATNGVGSPATQTFTLTVP